MHLSSDIDISSGLAGGIVLGISSTAYLYLTGRISGLSGILEGVVMSHENDKKCWACTYVVGLLSSGMILSIYAPQAFAAKEILNNQTIALAGLLVGLGSRMGSGCTSGHGLCGLSRLSLRSFGAVLAFNIAGAVSASLTRSSSLRSYFYVSNGFSDGLNPNIYVNSLLSVGVSVYCYRHEIQTFFNRKTKIHINNLDLMDHLASLFSSTLFGLGLGLSGMCNSDRVLKWLDFAGVSGWDPSLMSVLGSGVLFNMVARAVLSKLKSNVPLSKAPLTHADSFKFGIHPANTKINMELIIGSVLFGLGWGLAGICPGPGIVSLGAGSAKALIFMPALVSGILLFNLIKRFS